MLNYNGFDLEYDFMDVENRKFFENQVEWICDKMVSENKDVTKDTASDIMERNCDNMIIFIDSLFEEGTALKVTGERKHYRKLLELCKLIILESRKQDNELVEELQSSTNELLKDNDRYSLNREERRLLEKKKGRVH